MTLWIFLWIVLAVFVLGIFFWSTEILLKQKRCWKAFAEKNGLTYESPAFLQSGGVNGQMGPFEVFLYSEEQLTNDVSRRRFRTIFLVHFYDKFPAAGIVGTQIHRPFIEGLSLPEVHKPDFAGWDGSLPFHTRSDADVKAFMTPDRYQALQKLLSIKNTEAFWIFDDVESYFRFESYDPMTDLEALERRVKAIVRECEKLRP
ncbi:MAG: hypothetical protein AB7E85_06850 [Pseudobdellovibrionaceae bacterium]